MKKKFPKEWLDNVLQMIRIPDGEIRQNAEWAPILLEQLDAAGMLKDVPEMEVCEGCGCVKQKAR